MNDVRSNPRFQLLFRKMRPDQIRKFLDFWRDADPVIAEVEDTRKMLAGLM